jgi:hypothetical protein
LWHFFKERPLMAMVISFRYKTIMRCVLNILQGNVNTRMNGIADMAGQLVTALRRVIRKVDLHARTLLEAMA